MSSAYGYGLKAIRTVLLGLGLLCQLNVAQADSISGMIGGTIGSVDLDIYLAPVLDSSGTAVEVKDSLEEKRGGMTVVNLDNDDGDNDFDIDDTNGVAGDDELVQLDLGLEPYLLYQAGFFDTGTITLNATAGAGDIKVYKDANKLTPYTLGTAIPASEFTDGGILSGAIRKLYVEGIKPHTSPQHTKLKLTFTNGTDNFEDEVSLTIVGVESVAWEGINNSVNNNNALDADPSFSRIAPIVPSSAAANSPVRVFPGKRLNASGTPEANLRNRVKVKVKLTVPPPHDMSLFLRSFDMDDPTEDQAPADGDLATVNGDNNGCASISRSTGNCIPGLPLEMGAFVHPTTLRLDDEYEMEFKASNTKLEEEVEFSVSIQPGDNFAVVANADEDFINYLQNLDIPKAAAAATFPNTFGSTQAEVDDNLRITDNRMTSTTIADNEVREAEHYVSQILTIWRFLHFEVDSMEAVPTTGANKNSVDRHVTEIRGNGSIAEEIEVAPVTSAGSGGSNVGVQGEINTDGAGLYITDISLNRDTVPSGSGRFENGSMTFTNTGTTNTIEQNGNFYLYNRTGFTINFTATAGTTMLSGTVIEYAPASRTFTVNAAAGSGASAAWAALAAGGGTIIVEGESMPVTTANQAASTITVSIYRQIPINVHDDDPASPAGATSLINLSLTGLPTAHFNDLQETDVIATNKLAQVFIRPKYDLTNASYSDANVSFISNTEYNPAYDWDTQAFNHEAFWVAYVLYAYQDSYQDIRQDYDGRSEGTTWASANNALNNTPGSSRSGGVLVYLESIRDGSLAAMSLLMVHEIGHNLSNLRDSYVGPCVDGIMFGQLPLPTGTSAACYKFTLQNVKDIRDMAEPED